MEAKRLRIVYMGTPDFAVAPLRRLVEEGYNIVGVVTMPDKPAGRGLHMQASAVKRYAVEAGLPVYQPEKLKDPQFVETLRSLAPDLGIVIAFRMLPEIVWAMPRLGTFNLHASLLPQYRGAAPINWAIINGEKESGVTTFLLNHEIDKGAILCQQRVAIDEEDDAGTLHDKLMNAGTDLVIETIERIASGAIAPVDQQTIEPQVIRDAPKIFKETCRIDWSASGDTVRNLVRGLSPYPAAWSELHKEGASPIGVKIFRVHAETCPADRLPASGTLVTDGRTFMKVACADGYLFLDELQLAGKKRMAVADLLRGFKEAASYAFR
ncbi:MAG TPA: methionyl-tRNA formyltransferase [Candidatus Alistipes pullicola]|nr:methionyl-tRNA formyltransferase [Candidatus Alistipes pullicola]